MSLMVVASCFNTGNLTAFAAEGADDAVVVEATEIAEDSTEQEEDAEEAWYDEADTAEYEASPATDFTIELDSNNNVIIKKYIGQGGAVVIPDEIGGAAVASIADNAFKGNKTITSVVFPKNLTSVGEYAFYECSNLETLTLNEGLRITSKYSFGYCTKLTEVVLPKTLEELGDQAFAHCSLLSKVYISKSINDVELSPFASCPLKTVEFEEGITRIPSSKASGNYKKGGLFAYSGLEEITIPDTVETIGHCAFLKCEKLKKVTFPKNLKEIEENAFWKCSSLEKAILPEGLESIEGGAFEECSALAEVFLPQTIAKCGKNIFNEDTSLKKITFEEGTTTIFGADPVYNKDGIFGGCGVEEIYLPDSVTKISDCAFGNCKELRTIRMSPNITYIGKYAFWGCAKLGTITLPEGIECLYDCCFYGCSALNNVVIPANVATIDKYVFRGCSSLESIFIPKSVNSVDDGAFRECSSLKSVEFEVHNQYTSEIPLGENVFMDCTSLTDVQLGNRIKKIQKDAFTGCTALKEIQIPYGVTIIAQGAFYKCNNLEILFVPSSVKTFGTTDTEFERSYNHVPLVYVEKGVSTASVSAAALGWDCQLGIWNVDFTDAANEFPDKNFNNQLYEQRVDKNIDTRLTLREIEATKELNVSDKEIADVTGLQLLTSLEKLDVSKNAIETFVVGEANSLAALKNLRELNCAENKIGILNTSANSELKKLDVSGNKLLALNLSKNTKLTDLTVGEQAGEGLVTADSYFDYIFNLKDTYGEDYDWNAVVDLEDEYLGVGEDAERVDEGIIWRMAYHVPDVFTYGYRVSYGSGATKTMKATVTLGNAGLEPDSAEFKEAFPDGNFRTAIYAALDFNKNNKISRTEERSAKTLDVKELEIADIKGIERLYNLTELVAENNQIKAADLTANKQLESLNLGNNKLSKLDLSKNTKLKSLYVGGNKLAAIDISKLLNLQTFRGGKQSFAVTGSITDDGVELDISAYDAGFDKASVSAVKAIDASGNETAGEVKVTDKGFVIPTDAAGVSYTWTTSKGDLKVTVSAGEEIVDPNPDPEPQPEPDPQPDPQPDPDPVIEDDDESGRDPEVKPSEDYDEETKVHDYGLYMVTGQTYSFPATYGELDAESEKASQKISWKTSDKKKFSISGKFKGKASAATSTNEVIKVFDGVAVADSAYVYTVRIAAPKIVQIKDAEKTDYKKTATITPGNSITLGIAGLGQSEEYAEAYDVSWYSSNVEIAKVVNGKVTGYAKGTAKITAYVNGKAYAASVKVDEKETIAKKLEDKAEVKLVPLQSASLKFANKEFKASGLTWFGVSGEELISMQGYDSKGKAAETKIAYYQNDVVRITPSGKVTAVGVGSASLAAKDKNGKVQYVEFTVSAPVTNTIYINLKKSKTIKYYNVKSNAAEWSSSDASVTDGNAGGGKIKGGKVGYATVSCKYDPYNTGNPIVYKTLVVVENPKLDTSKGKWSSVNKAGTSGTLELKVGEKYAINAGLKYQKAIFDSNKPAVAFASDSGVITARTPGKATISAKVNGTNISIKVVVTK